MRKIIALLLAGALLALSACSVTASAATITDPDVKSRGDDEVYADFGECCDDIDAINQKLRGVCIRIAQNFEEDSYIYSPYSLYLALAAVAQGASDEVFEVLPGVPFGKLYDIFNRCARESIRCAGPYTMNANQRRGIAVVCSRGEGRHRRHFDQLTAVTIQKARTPPGTVIQMLYINQARKSESRT